jgi:hypothetical protein
MLEGFQEKDTESGAGDSLEQTIDIEKSATFCRLASE